MTNMISFHDFVAVDALAKRLRIDPQAVRRARIAFYKKSLGEAAALDLLPDAFRSEVRFRSLFDTRSFTSSIDNATKLVTRTEAGFSIESVLLRPATGRVALCVSSQIGCAAACAFCATGQMGVARDLTRDEIIDQVIIANESLAAEGRRVRNLVFMGMGEPMHNEAAVNAALRLLQDPKGFDQPASRILVSTVGVPEPLLRTAREFPTTNFALSLHSADDSVRREIIPLAKRYPLVELKEAVLKLNQIQPLKTAVMIEYLMLDGFNDRAEDADALLAWLEGLRVHVNLIPYNPIASAPQLRSSPREVIERFSARLRLEGLPTTIRYSLGRDIEAACGQLVRDENREIARQISMGSA